jgi:hypothetical protein
MKEGIMLDDLLKVEPELLVVSSALAIPSFFEIKESRECEIFLKRIGTAFF